MASILVCFLGCLCQLIDALIEDIDIDEPPVAPTPDMEDVEDGHRQPLNAENAHAPPASSVVHGASTHDDAEDEAGRPPRDLESSDRAANIPDDVEEESGLGSESGDGASNVSNDAAQAPAPLSSAPGFRQTLELHQVWHAQVRARLRILQQTMDPLVASVSYNQQHSAIYRLTDEILLLILDQVTNDIVSFFCLRDFSHRFRRLVDDRRFRHHIFSHYSGCKPLSGLMKGFS
ncbi:hypothetical protein ACJ41O_007160 [Fusarium nematophilum]